MTRQELLEKDIYSVASEQEYLREREENDAYLLLCPKLRVRD